jgi:hypothetical protein
MTAVILRLTLMSLIVGNSFNFTILVRISADTIRIVHEMRPCADILSRDPLDSIRIVSSEHCPLPPSHHILKRRRPRHLPLPPLPPHTIPHPKRLKKLLQARITPHRLPPTNVLRILQELIQHNLPHRQPTTPALT